MGAAVSPSKHASSQGYLNQRVTEMSASDLVQETVWEEFTATENVCCFRYQKTTQKKIVWESKFIRSCEMHIQEFGWAGDLIDIVNQNELPKLKYYREVHQLKKDKSELFAKVQAEAEVLSSPDELEKFKKNLKKSVIISFTQGSKNKELSMMKSSIAPMRSRLERRVKNTHSSLFYREKSQSDSNSQFVKSKSSMSSLTIVDPPTPDKDVSKETALELEIFLKFSNILERHLGDMTCVLGRIKKSYIQYFELHYRDSAVASKQLDFIIESAQHFLELLRDAVMDYYNLSTFTPPSQGSNIFISNDDNILSTVTAIVFRDHTFYNCLFNVTAFEFKDREKEFDKILNHLKGSNPQKFTVKDKFCLNWLTIKSYVNSLSDSMEDSIVQNIEITDIVVQHPQPYKLCMNSLNEMAKSRAPVNKLKSIMSCSQAITNEIEKFYDMNGLKKEKWMLDADQVLSIFCYLIIGARVEHLHSHLFILDNFASSHQMISMTGYYLSVIRCAVQQLENQYCDLFQPGEGSSHF